MANMFDAPFVTNDQSVDRLLRAGPTVLLVFHRQAHGEGAALPRLRLHADGALVLLDQALHQGQA